MNKIKWTFKGTNVASSDVWGEDVFTTASLVMWEQWETPKIWGTVWRVEFPMYPTVLGSPD